jgi:hypothetical protein
MSSTVAGCTNVDCSIPSCVLSGHTHSSPVAILTGSVLMQALFDDTQQTVTVTVSAPHVKNLLTERLQRSYRLPRSHSLCYLKTQELLGVSYKQLQCNRQCTAVLNCRLQTASAVLM